MSKTKKILTNVLILLVLLSNASYAVSSSLCEMTKKAVCKCSMNVDNSFNNAVEKISNQTKSCCKIEIKFISNSSDFESNNKISKSNISTAIIFTNISQYLNPSYSKINAKGILLFFNITNDIPVKNSSLLI